MATTRVQIDFSEERIRELEALQKTLDLGTRKELFSYALGLMAWAVKQRQMGRQILVGDVNTRTALEVSIPYLDRIRATREPDLFDFSPTTHESLSVKSSSKKAAAA